MAENIFYVASLSLRGKAQRYITLQKTQRKYRRFPGALGDIFTAGLAVDSGEFGNAGIFRLRPLSYNNPLILANSVPSRVLPELRT